MDNFYSPFSLRNTNNLENTNTNSLLGNSDIQTNYLNHQVRNTDLTSNKISDWKKIVADRVVRRINERRENRFDSILSSKKEILEEIKHENLINGYCHADNLELSDYFDKILTMFESDKIISREYELEVCLNSNISVCPICSYPVILASNKVICMNLCFEYFINSNFFNQNFTLDNFVDLYAEIYRNHKHCINFAKFEMLFFENEVSLICGKCFKENFIYY